MTNRQEEERAAGIAAAPGCRPGPGPPGRAAVLALVAACLLVGPAPAAAQGGTDTASEATAEGSDGPFATTCGGHPYVTLPPTDVLKEIVGLVADGQHGEALRRLSRRAPAGTLEGGARVRVVDRLELPGLAFVKIDRGHDRPPAWTTGGAVEQPCLEEREPILGGKKGSGSR